MRWAPIEIHPDDIEAFEAQRDAAVEDCKTFNVELRIFPRGRPDSISRASQPTRAFA